MSPVTWRLLLVAIFIFHSFIRQSPDFEEAFRGSPVKGIAFGIANNEAVEIPPIIVKVLHEIIEKVFVFEKSFRTAWTISRNP